jgi:hypothetical protein
MRKIVATGASLAMLAAGAASAQTGVAAPPPAGTFSLGAEALIWWLKDSPTPTPIVTDGLIGQPATNVLLGGGDQNTNTNYGFRVTAGWAFSARYGVDANFFYIDKRSSTQGVASSGQLASTDLLVPFFDVTKNRENVTEISFSPSYGGSAQTEYTNRLMGAEVNANWALAAQRPFDSGWLLGFRWLQLKETYTITTSSSFIPPQPADIWITTDQFDTRNNFYGAQIGARVRYDADRWYVAGSVKVAIGAMEQKVDINGSLATNDFTDLKATQTFPGGYFALPTNIGGYSRTEFAWVPEVQINLGYRFTPAVSIYAGYSFLYASDVVRPGNQINRNINPTQSVSYVGEPPVRLQGPAQPSFSFNTSDFWAQGVNIGLSVRF